MSDPKPPAWLKPMNKVMMGMQKLGIVAGPVRVLTVPGRKSGEPRSTPATPFTLHDSLYVVGGYPHIPARTGCSTPVPLARELSQAAASQSESPSSSSPQNKHGRCCARFPTKYREALGSINARGW
jgi:hypothetical protein